MCGGSFCVWSILVAVAFWLAGSPSQSKPVGFASSPKGRALGITVKFPAQCKGVPLGELANVVSLRGWLQHCRKRHCKCRLPLRPLCVKMRLERSAERDKRKNKNNPSSDYAQSTAEGILNRFVCLKRLSAEKQQTAFSAPPPCNLCNCDKFS